MTATTTAPQAETIASRVRVPWRRLAWVTWRQHRVAVVGLIGAFALAAVLLAVTGVQLQEAAARLGPGWMASRYWFRYHYIALGASVLALQGMPVLAGMFLGAPLLAREAENGTTHLAWTQGVSRTKLLVAKVLVLTGLLAIAAAGVGFEFGWWLTRPSRSGQIASEWAFGSGASWGPAFFGLHPLPFAGWVTMALSLGVLLGAAIRRTVPAMAAMLACYVALLCVTTAYWRMSYLPPLHRRINVQFSAGGGYSYSAYWSGQPGPGPGILSSALGWPDGRLLSRAQIARHAAAWFRLHHIKLWVTYQPASRYGLFQVIEFGWLIALAAILIAATAVLIRRRAA
jgi:ABC-2 family transporter protein